MIILIPFQKCKSQTIIDNSKLRDAAKLIEIGKIDREKVILYKEQVQFLNERIALKDSIINAYVSRDTIGSRIINSYKTEVANLIEQRDVAIKAMNRQNKLLRRQKRKTVFVTLAAPAITAAAFIYLKK